MSKDSSMQPQNVLGQGMDTLHFFGEPYQDGNRTVIPLLSTPFDGGPAGAATIWIEGTKVSIRPLPNRLPIVLKSLALAGWNVYWLLKMVRVWLRQKQ